MNELLVVAGVISGIIALYIGWTSITDQDKAWEWQEHKHRVEGIAESHRSVEWQKDVTCRGIIMLGFGVMFLIASFILLIEGL